MKYLFTTLAIGQEYFDKAKQFSLDLYKKDPNFFRIIVSDIVINTEIPNTIVISPPNNSVFYIKNSFNYNLKYLAIKAAYEYDVEFIIFIDADWRVYSSYCSSKIESFLSNNNLDFYFERPHLIGAGKHDGNNCFWKHKIEPYNLLNTKKYDNANVCNEQFLIFKKSPKLKVFIDAWEYRNQFGINNNIWPFAEGVEIGMSSIDAGFEFSYSRFCEISSCFQFESISGMVHTRF